MTSIYFRFYNVKQSHIDAFKNEISELKPFIKRFTQTTIGMNSYEVKAFVENKKAPELQNQDDVRQLYEKYLGKESVFNPPLPKGVVVIRPVFFN